MGKFPFFLAFFAAVTVSTRGIVSSAAVVEPAVLAHVDPAGAAAMPLSIGAAPLPMSPIPFQAIEAVPALSAAAGAPLHASAPEAGSIQSSPASGRLSPPPDARASERAQREHPALDQAQTLLDSLLKHAAQRPEDPYAHAMTAEEAGETARAILQEHRGLSPGWFPLRAVALGGDDYKFAISHISEPEVFARRLHFLHQGLRDVGGELPSGVRIQVSRLLLSLASEFLSRVEREPGLPDSVRGIAVKARASYIENDRLLAALAWGRQEEARIKDARQAILAEHVADDRSDDKEVGVSESEGEWRPPAADAAPPAEPGRGVMVAVESMAELGREFKDSRARFELARGRREAARRLGLPAAETAREDARWKASVLSYGRSVDSHEYSVNRLIDRSLAYSFAQVDVWDRPSHLPDQPGLSFQEVAGGYRLEASFETKIADPAVIAAFRRSIETYWKGRFQEEGREKIYETRVSVRVLAADEAYSREALRLIDSGTLDPFANSHNIALNRRFSFYAPAHEFGHILGLSDEYSEEYVPEEMSARHEQDRSNLMASPSGLVLPSHFRRVVQLLRDAGKLDSGSKTNRNDLPLNKK